MKHLQVLFPKLRDKTYQVTSRADDSYNCIAWAARDTAHCWWPDDPDIAFWPGSVPREETLEAFRSAFARLGYSACDNADLEAGFEKIALFANNSGVPKHAARQLDNGRWTSNLGYLEDIEHELHDLEGAHYGIVALVMKRVLAPPK